VGAGEEEATRPSPGGAEEPVDVADELRRHEELLRAATPAVRVAVVRERAVSYGVGVDPAAAYLERSRAERIATAARSSGGTGLLHLEGDLLWAVVLPRADVRVGRDYVRAYGRLGRGIVQGLATAGVVATWVAAPGLSNDCCPLSSRGEVLASEGMILGGAAQHATSRALLHHGGISWKVDRPCVERLFDLPTGGPADRLGGVADLRPRLDRRALVRALEQALDDEIAR
jgi:lipoate-protein ligase A